MAGGGGAGGVAGTQGGYAGIAGAIAGAAGAAAGASGTGGAPVDASVPDPWSYGGRPVTQIDVKWCPAYNFRCAVCSYTLGGTPDAGPPPSTPYVWPAPVCEPRPVDAGTDGASSAVAHRVGPVPCLGGTLDGGAPEFTEVVVQPNGGTASLPQAYCQFLPANPIATNMYACQLLNLNKSCVSDCSDCPLAFPP